MYLYHLWNLLIIYQVNIISKSNFIIHNGLKNIFECLGNPNYPRLRFGVGSDFVQGKQINHVLGDFATEEQSLLPERLEKATQAIKAFTTIGLGRTMSEFNGK